MRASGRGEAMLRGRAGAVSILVLGLSRKSFRPGGVPNRARLSDCTLGGWAGESNREIVSFRASGRGEAKLGGRARGVSMLQLGLL